MGRVRLGLVVLCALFAVLTLSGAVSAAVFLAGPSVRVTANASVEFKWQTDVAWFGKIEVFDNAGGTGSPILTKRDEYLGGTAIKSTTHAITADVGGGAALQTDTTYYFKITNTDPTGALGDLFTPAPLPSFFTGVQALSNVQVSAGTTSAVVSWQGNVIGLGHVDYGLDSSYGLSADDANNVTDHSITLTGLQPGTIYAFKVCNRHAIDGDCLASSTGSFQTYSTAFTDLFLQPLDQSTDPSHPVLNTGKNGKVISAKVQISQGGSAITNLNAPGPVTIAVSKLATCSATAGTDPVESYADAGQSSAGTNQFHYDTASQSWVYGLDTKALGLITGNCYRIDVSVNGTKITNAFAVFQPTK